MGQTQATVASAWKFCFELLGSCRETAELFELGEASCDAVPLFVEVLVILALQPAVGFRRDRRDRSHRCDMFDDVIGVIAFIGEYKTRLALAQQGWDHYEKERHLNPVA